MLALLLFAAAAPEPESALEKLARAVVEQVQRAAPEAPVALWVEASSPALARGFGSVLAAQLAGKKSSPVVIDAPNPAAAERLARDKDLRTLIRVTLSAESTRLSARGDALHTWVNFWAGAAATRSGAAVAIAATVDADAQALALASVSASELPPRTTPLQLTLSAFAKLAAPPAAIAIGDLDGDKHPEIVVLTDDEVLVFDAGGKTIGRTDLRALPVCARPTRESFGALALGPGKVAWLSGRRAHGEVLSYLQGSLKVTGATDEAALDGVTVRLLPGFNAFATEATWRGVPQVLPATLTTTNSRGALTLFLFADGTGAVARAAPIAKVFSHAPSAAVLVDLDGDGAVELLATSSRFFAEPDEVKVFAAASAEAITGSAGSLGEAAVLWSGLAPRGRIFSAAAGDLDGDGAEEVVLGSWLADGTGELLVARRVAP